MGADFSMMRQQPPPGSVVFVIESEECCSDEPIRGRKWDATMPKPSFVNLSSSEWSNFVGTMGGKVRSYKKEGYGTIILILGILLGTFVFHPAIGVLGRSISGIAEEGRRLSDETGILDVHPLRRLGDETEVAATHSAEDGPFPGGKDATYLTWGDYAAACTTGCYYADVAPNGSACSGDLYASTRYNSAGRRISPSSVCGENRRHDPCYAEVKLGGFDKDIGYSDWFSCCGAWSYGSHCTEAQKERLGKLRCEGDTSRIDGCQGGHGDVAHEEEEKGRAGGVGLAIVLQMACFFVGIGGGIFWSMKGRSDNERVDRDIDSYLTTLSGARTGATFSLIRSWTQACKPKGTRTYRALCIAPAVAVAAPAGMPGAGIALAPAVAVTPVNNTVQTTAPPGSQPGDAVTVQGPSGQQFQVVIPAGVAPGQPFMVQLPAAAPVVVAGVAVPMA